MPNTSPSPELSVLASQLPRAPLSQIANIIRKDWKNISPYAVDYLRAMLTLPSISSKYGADSGESIVMYFLSNASSYRGPIARLVKAELNRRLKGV